MKNDLPNFRMLMVFSLVAERKQEKDRTIKGEMEELIQGKFLLNPGSQESSKRNPVFYVNTLKMVKQLLVDKKTILVAD